LIKLSWQQQSNSEQKARDRIDDLSTQAGWIIQPKQNQLECGSSVAVREYQTDAGPPDYVLFVEPISIIEAKRKRRASPDHC